MMSTSIINTKNGSISAIHTRLEDYIGNLINQFQPSNLYQQLRSSLLSFSTVRNPNSWKLSSCLSWATFHCIMHTFSLSKCIGAYLVQRLRMIVPLLTLHPLCSKAISKNPPPPILEFTHGGANCRITSLTVITPVTCSLSFIRKLKQLLVCVICAIACLSVSFALLVTGESILDVKLFFRWRLPAVWLAPWSCSMVGSVSVLSVFVRTNSSIVKILSLHRNRYFCHASYIDSINSTLLLELNHYS